MLHTLSSLKLLRSERWESFQIMRAQPLLRHRFNDRSAKQRRLHHVAVRRNTAHRGGSRYGDQIINIKGDQRRLEPRGFQTSFSDREGKPVTVKVARAGVKDPIEFKFIREAVPLPSIKTLPGGNGVGYINLDRGIHTTTSERERSDARLAAAGNDVADPRLRNNRGGWLIRRKNLKHLLYRGRR